MYQVARSYALHTADFSPQALEVRFADLDGDGELEWLLTRGAEQQAAFCQDGGLIWEYYDDDPLAATLRGDAAFPALDLMRSGQPVLVCVRRVQGQLRVCLVDARRGSLLQHAPLPLAEAAAPGTRLALQVVHLTGAFYPQAILIAWDGLGVAALDARLNLLWQRDLRHKWGRAHPTMGYTPFAWDIDGDGYDEFLAGSCLLDHDGRTLWVAPDQAALRRPEGAGSVRMQPLEEGAPARLLLSAAASCYALDGTLLWSHPQIADGRWLQTGRLRADLPGRQVVLFDAASQRLHAFAAGGTALWDIPAAGTENLCLGDWDGDGLAEVFAGGPAGITVFDGMGRLIEEMPGALLYVFDLLGDRRAEVATVVPGHSSWMLRLLSNAAANPHPASNRPLYFRRTTTDMYNASRC